MARVIPTPTSSGPVGPFEPKVLEALRIGLPNSYAIAPNFQLKQGNHPALEYDFVVLAPHAMFAIEAKEWYGRLTGDDTEWLINKTPRKCPMWLVSRKSKVLKTMLGPVGRHVWIEPALVYPDGTANQLGGTWGKSAFSVQELIEFLLDEKRIDRRGDVAQYHEQIERALQGAWGKRQRDNRRLVGSYEILETLHEDDDSGEYLARRVLLEDDATRYRVRTWRLDQSLPETELKQQKAVIMRPTEAISKVGRHPNLLPILQFDFVPEDNEFFEVTEWSDFGTLHGYLHNSERDRLTLRERLQIAEGVASALEAVHAQGVVHRNVCPESIVVGFDRTPRLTDFDRAYIESKQTIFEQTDRKRNEAFIAPELADKSDYDFDTSADMYSFGVLLYYLLCGAPPFASPKEAESASGKPAKLPTSAIEGIATEVDALVVSLLNIKDPSARPNATSVVASLGQLIHADSTAVRSPDRSTKKAEPASFEIGTIVDDVFRIDQLLGSGAFSRVYRVYHLDHQETFAMKVLLDPSDTDVLLHEYNSIGKHLPTHPNIARVIWMARLAPPDGRPYILTEYVDGETLEPYCKGEKQLAWSDIVKVGCEVLDALHAMHPKTAQLDAHTKHLEDQSSISGEDYDRLQELRHEVDNGILHRDLKPANILLELPSHAAKLIDFNIASKLAHAQGRGGTPRYWAPDRGRPKWLPNMDLFSLGVVLFELLTHRHPFPEDNPEAGLPFDPRVLRKDLNLSEEVAKFLLKAVSPNGDDRFQTAADMKSALLAIHSVYAPISSQTQGAATTPVAIRLTNDEKGLENYNPYVSRLLTLYSQASRSNAGTRGLDEIAKLTYVQTNLDTKLAPHIAEGKFRLVIITGNAGDGKTAFLQQVEQYFATELGVALDRIPTGNGSRWRHEQLVYESNYDGSQDEGDVESDEVLARFLAPFKGNHLGGLDSDQVRLIAVNEGRLLDFLTHSSFQSEFAGLRNFVLKALDAEEDLPERGLLVNLNLRSVSAGAEKSLVERQLLALTDGSLWKPCQTCEHASVCPLKFNADSISDPASGQAVRSRIRRLFEVVHLRRKLHVTMRDLRSALSWILLRDHSCEDIAELVQNQDTNALVSLCYPQALADRGGVGKHGTDDRLVAILRETDPGRVNAPQLDRRLDRDPATAIPWMSFETRATKPREFLEKLSKDAPRHEDEVAVSQLFQRRRALAEQWRRWAYFERRDEGWKAMLPYRALVDLDAVLSRDESTGSTLIRIRDRVVEAISLSEGLRHPGLLKGYLALRVSRIKSPTIKSYRLFERESFFVRIPSYGKLAEYLECAPDTLELVVRPELGRAHLRISLDLLEMLELIRTGYRPSPADLQGMFVNLLIFRNELMNLPFSRIVVTPDELDLYQITASSDPAVGVTLALTQYADALAAPRND